jgi:hypothetical protein
MSLLKFFTTSSLTPVVALSFTSASRTTVAPTGATATWQLLSTGIGKATKSNGTFNTWTWLLSGLASDYQISMALVSGATPSGDPLSSWLSLSSSRSWFVSRGGTFGTTISNLQVSIKNVATGIIVATAAITITANVDT